MFNFSFHHDTNLFFNGLTFFIQLYKPYHIKQFHNRQVAFIKMKYKNNSRNIFPFCSYQLRIQPKYTDFFFYISVQHETYYPPSIGRRLWPGPRRITKTNTRLSLKTQPFTWWSGQFKNVHELLLAAQFYCKRLLQMFDSIIYTVRK